MLQYFFSQVRSHTTDCGSNWKVWYTDPCISATTEGPHASPGKVITIIYPQWFVHQRILAEKVIHESGSLLSTLASTMWKIVGHSKTRMALNTRRFDPLSEESFVFHASQTLGCDHVLCYQTNCIMASRRGLLNLNFLMILIHTWHWHHCPGCVCV